MGSFLSKTVLEDILDVEQPLKENFETPTRLRKVGCVVFDPRSPTLNIDRTPILVKADKEECPAEIPVDPRSPSVGITRTPLPQCPQQSVAPLAEDLKKDHENLVQILSFPELDSLSLSNIEDELSIIETGPKVESKPVEELLDFTLSNITASTPTSTPIKVSSKVTNLDKENSIVKTRSPINLTPAKRVPFGDINRSVQPASPRFALQNKQKLNLRAEIQRSSVKAD